MSAIAARLERLPLSGFHRKLLLIGGLGYMFDGLDSSSLAFLLPVVSKLWHLTSAETGLVASSTYIGYFFGAFLSGVLADVIGRRRIMMSALAIYCCRVACERDRHRLAHVFRVAHRRGFWIRRGDRGDRAVSRRVRATALPGHLLRRTGRLHVVRLSGFIHSRLHRCA